MAKIKKIKNSTKKSRAVKANAFYQRKKHNLKSKIKTKTLPALARLELSKRLIDKEKKNQYNDNKNERVSNEKRFRTDIADSTRICKERKIRRNEIMAKTRGRGLRIRRATWTLDSYTQCRG